MSHLVHRRLRAPNADGAALIDPPMATLRPLLRDNVALARQRDLQLQGKPITDFMLAARAEVLASAMAYTRAYRGTVLPPEMHHSPFVLAGHQPDLFHPGVWFKNFLLSIVSRRERAVAINMIVDTDTLHMPSIRGPTTVAGKPRVEMIAYDAPSQPIPFEERLIRDKWLFSSFDRRIKSALDVGSGGDQAYQLLVEPLWKAAMGAVSRHGPRANLGRVIAEARHALESTFQLQTLELPLSAVAQTRHFRQFALHLLTSLPRLQAIYNSALSEYRTVNRVRSQTHPVPGLEDDDGWLEAPFMLWTEQEPVRRHLFVRFADDSLVLSDRHGVRFTIDATSENLPDKAIEQLAAAEARGIKLRPRALITTMYARLVLSDLFIHGIGGAKYDELTDLIIRRFFGIEPPAYVTATATFRLPIDRPDVSIDDVRTSAQRIRELRYRPESFLRDPLVTTDSDLSAKLAPLAAEKREFLDEHDLRRCSQDVFDRLDRLNRAMHDLLRPVEEQLRERHAELIAQAKQSQLLGSREFSFVLFPSGILPARLLDLCKVSS